MRNVETGDAPISSSPLSQAIVHGDTVYVSGQVPYDPETGEIVGEDIGAQTDRTIDNVEAVLEAAGTSLGNVVKATVFLTDIGEFDGMNAVYAERMPEPHPARSAVAVADLAADVKVEIEVVAALP